LGNSTVPTEDFIETPLFADCVFGESTWRLIRVGFVTGALNHLAAMPVIDRDKGQSEYTKIVSSKPHKVILKRDSSHPVDFYRYVGALQVVLASDG
jgi:hypothetical protein